MINDRRDDFSAYPKELSGGMRQRVGEPALMIKPDVLLMDEPFSVWIITAENNDLMEIWQETEQDSMKGILFVTHNIEEAVLVADRILVFGSSLALFVANSKSIYP